MSDDRRPATDVIDEVRDWTALEMFTAIAEIMEPSTSITETPRAHGRGTVLRATCSLDGCGYITNPRGSEDDIADDLIRHAADAHAAKVRRRIRDVQRRARIAEEHPLPTEDTTTCNPRGAKRDIGPPFTARHRTDCGATGCTSTINEGETARMVDGVAVHARCAA